jgi:hypothetical protein
MQKKRKKSTQYEHPLSTAYHKDGLNPPWTKGEEKRSQVWGHFGLILATPNQPKAVAEPGNAMQYISPPSLIASMAR